MNRFQQFMENLLRGRHGTDQLSLFLSLLGLVLIVGGPAFGEPVTSVLYLIGAVSLGFSVFRVFSRNNSARDKENNRFLSIFKRSGASSAKAAERQREKEKKRRLKEKLKTHEMFYCPKCKTACFVPKGKGKIRITCPKCGEKFIGKT